MEYNDLMKEAEEHNKQLYRTMDVNVCDLLTWQDRDAIANIVDKRVAKEYGSKFTCSGYFLC